jgi:hypothetical protein
MVKRYSHIAEQHTATLLDKLDERQFGKKTTPKTLRSKRKI